MSIYNHSVEALTLLCAPFNDQPNRPPHPKAPPKAVTCVLPRMIRDQAVMGNGGFMRMRLEDFISFLCMECRFLVDQM